MSSSHRTVQWLKDQDFEGFIRFAAIPQEEIPTGHGVYAVVRESMQEPCFLLPGTGRKGSHYSLDVLQCAWVPEAAILYFGKAECKLGIYEQLEDAQDLKVCWRVTGNRDPVEVESALIDLFKGTPEGPRPFANRIDGKKNQE